MTVDDHQRVWRKCQMNHLKSLKITLIDCEWLMSNKKKSIKKPKKSLELHWITRNWQMNEQKSLELPVSKRRVTRILSKKSIEWTKDSYEWPLNKKKKSIEPT